MGTATCLISATEISVWFSLLSLIGDFKLPGRNGTQRLCEVFIKPIQHCDGWAQNHLSRKCSASLGPPFIEWHPVDSKGKERFLWTRNVWNRKLYLLNSGVRLGASSQASPDQQEWRSEWLICLSLDGEDSDSVLINSYDLSFWICKSVESRRFKFDAQLLPTEHSLAFILRHSHKFSIRFGS